MAIVNIFTNNNENRIIVRKALTRLINVFVILAFLSSAIGVKTAFAWFDAGWAYRITLTVSNPGSLLTDYQIAIRLDSTFPFGHAKSDGSDFRVISADDLTPVPFWIESWTAGNALIWVKLSSIPEGDSTIYLYYGNPAAAALSDGMATFQAYDGFEGYTVDSPPPSGGSGPLQWGTPTGTVVVTDSPVRQGNRSLRFTNASNLTGTFAPLSQGSIGAWMRRPPTNGVDLDIYFYYGGLTAVVGLGGNGNFHYWNGAFQNTGVAYTANTWYLVTISLNGTTHLYDYVVYNENLTEMVRVNGISLAGGETAINRAMFYAADGYSGNGYADDFHVSPVSGTPPTLSLGAEESVAGGAGADLVLVQSDSPDPVSTGSPLTYTFQVTNLGTSSATGVTLIDALPSDVTFSSASAGCTYDVASHTVTCTIGNLVVDASASLTITVTPTATGTLNNLGMVSSIETDPDRSNNSVLVHTTVLPDCPCSIWDDATIPETPAVPDGSPYEFGVRFRSNIAGYITGLRFYKGAGNTGTHLGHLWTNSGTQLAELTFTGESDTGWQEAVFSSPVAITANTTYVASYHTNTGYYSRNSPYFGTGFNNLPLRALADGEDGSNGVFLPGADSGFPTYTNGSANYWVDIVFNTAGVDNLPPTVSSVSPANAATGVGISANVTATFSEDLDPTSVDASTFYLQGPSGPPLSAAVTYNVGSRTAALDPAVDLLESTTYTAMLIGGPDGIQDLAGNDLQADYTWTFTTAVVDSIPPTVSSVSPANAATGVGTTANVTAIFSEDLDPTSVNASTFYLQGPSGPVLSAAVTYNAGSMTATLEPGGRPARIHHLHGHADRGSGWHPGLSRE